MYVFVYVILKYLRLYVAKNAMRSMYSHEVVDHDVLSFFDCFDFFFPSLVQPFAGLLHTHLVGLLDLYITYE